MAKRGKKKSGSVELNLTPGQVLARFTEGPKDGVFTDGACSGNPGPGGWGFVWVKDDEIVAQANGHAPHTTNNRMELQALIEAFKVLPEDRTVVIHSDSQLCVNTLTKWAGGWKRRGWKRKDGEVKNLDLVQEAYELKLRHPKAKVQWIKAHDGTRWNEYADCLATAYLRPEEPKPAAPDGADDEEPELVDGFDLARLRADTPGCTGRVHLNNAGAALMPSPVLAAVRRHLTLESEIGGYEAAEEESEAIAGVYDSVAELIGCEARNIALVDHATTAFARAVSSIPLGRGDLVITTNHDYTSNQIMFLSLRRRLGIELVRAPDLPEGGVDPEAVIRLVRQRRPKLVAITQMPTHSGILQPVREVGRVCREHRVPFLVDGCQTVGQLPIDVGSLGCDFFTASGRKFLRGPRGTGFLYVADTILEAGLAPLLPDLRGAEWETADAFRVDPTARRFETWELAFALVLGLGAAVRYALDQDMKAVARRGRALAAEVRHRLAAIDGIRVLDRGAWLGAIATFAVAGRDPETLLEELRRHGVNTGISYRRYAVLDFDRKQVDWALRVSPHYYNTEAEIDTLVEAVAELMESGK